MKDNSCYPCPCYAVPIDQCACRQDESYELVINSDELRTEKFTSIQDVQAKIDTLKLQPHICDLEVYDYNVSLDPLVSWGKYDGVWQLLD